MIKQSPFLTILLYGGMSLFIPLFAQNHALELESAKSYQNLAQKWKEEGNTDSAVHYLQKAGEIYQSQEFWTEYLAVKNQHGQFLLQKQKYQEAIDILTKAQDLVQTHLKAASKDLADNLQYLGICYEKQQEYDKAKPCLQKAIQIYQIQHSEHYLQLAATYNILGIVFENTSNFEDAIESFQQSIAFYQKLDKEQSAALAEVYLNLGSIYSNTGDYEKSLIYYEQGQQIQIDKLGENHPALGFSYYLISGFHLDKGAYEKSLNGYIKALDIFKKTFGEQAFQVGVVYNNLGLLLKTQGSYEESLRYYQQALNIFIQMLGEEHSYVGDVYNNLGSVYSWQGDSQKTLEFYKKSLQIRRKVSGDTSKTVADSYHNMGYEYKKQGNYTKALEYFQQAMAINNELFEAQHLNLVNSFLDLGEVYQAQGEYARARQNYEQALSIQKVNFKNKHPEIAYTYNNLAKLAFIQENYLESAQYTQAALCANLKGYNSEKLEDLPSLKDYSNANHLFDSFLQKAITLEQIYMQIPKRKNNLKIAYQHLLLADKLIDQTRGKAKTQEDKLFLSQHVAKLTETGIRICQKLHQSTRKQDYLERAFYFSQKSKAHVLLEALSEAQAKQFGGIPDSLLEQERDLKDNIIFYEQELALNPDSTQLLLYQQKLFDLNQTYQQLINRLEKNFPDYYALKYQIKTTSVAKLQSVLDKKTALVDYFTGDSLVYIFSITAKDYQLESRPVASQIKKYIRGLRNGLVFKQANTYVNSAVQLYEMLFPRQLPKTVEQLILLPDGSLSTIPFEVLLTSKVEKDQISNYSGLPYLIQQYQISYDYSPVLFYENIQKKNRAKAPKDFIAYAPVFDKDEKIGVSLNTRSLLTEFDQLDTTHTRSILNQLNQVTPIPATETEIEAIYKLFNNKQMAAQIYTRNKANESQVKSENLKEYKFIHFATHGFVNSDEPKLSGILLLHDSTSVEDGILFMGEIYNLDLQAELVTLSACETGLGKVQKGEGIIGLAQAFIYAGSKNVMVSLWKVSDASTSQLMIDFYEKLLEVEEKNLAGAIREAKLQMIQDATYANPYFWSPFVLIGR